MRLLSIALAILLSGCASKASTIVYSASQNPIQPIYVDCTYASFISAELETIIANPYQNNPRWALKFSAVAGNDTPEQRMKSAKAILWSIRTNCPGF